MASQDRLAPLACGDQPLAAEEAQRGLLAAAGSAHRRRARRGRHLEPLEIRVDDRPMAVTGPVGCGIGHKVSSFRGYERVCAHYVDAGGP